MAKPSRSHIRYWEKRLDEIFRYIDRNDIDMYKELTDLYSRSALDAQDEVFKFYGKYADDEGITLGQAKKRLWGEDLSDYQENARRYFEEAEDNPELLKRLNEQYRASRATRLEALQFELQYQLGLLNGTLQSTFEQYLVHVASHSYQKIMGGHSTTLNKPALEEVINRPWNGHNYSSDLWGNTDNLAIKLRQTFEKGFSNGLGVRQMAQEIRKDFNVAKSNAENLIRTDGTHIVTNATAKRYQDAGLKYYYDYVKVDERTTDICMEIHRKNERKLLSEMKPGVNAPPYHYSCRTGIVPDTEEINAEL